MSTPASDNDPHDPLHQALQRDAARLTEAPFDAALHYETIRRIRALVESAPRRSLWAWGHRLAWAAAVLAAITLLLRFVGPDATRVARYPSLHVHIEISPTSIDAAVAGLSSNAPTLPVWMSPTQSLLTLNPAPL